MNANRSARGQSRNRRRLGKGSLLALGSIAAGVAVAGSVLLAGMVRASGSATPVAGHPFGASSRSAVTTAPAILSGGSGGLPGHPVGVPSASAATPAAGASVAPWLEGCYAHPDIIDPAPCVADAMKGANATRSQFPATVPAGQTAPSEAVIENIARSANGAPASAAARAMAMPYDQAVKALGEGLGRPGLDPTLPVWLVTVDAPADQVSRAPGDTHAAPAVYSEIVDAANGAIIDYCAGCDSVP